MTCSSAVGLLLLAAIIGAFCLELGERYSIPGVDGLVSSAQATVGRPLTPVSVAGVARRTRGGTDRLLLGMGRLFGVLRCALRVRPKGSLEREQR